MAKLFEYALIFHPKQIKDTAGNDTTPPDELILAPTTVLCGSDKEALMTAARAIPEKYAKELDRVEIALRPF